MCSGADGGVVPHVFIQRWNDETRVLWRLPLVSTELTARRLYMWQGIAERPEMHLQITSAVFGPIRFEEPRNVIPPANDQGIVTSSINTWARQL